MTKKELKHVFEKCWSKETCSPRLKDKWSEENPSLGQCAITSLIVSDYCGGKIMRCMASTGSHYYNMIDDQLVDFTIEQFQGEIPLYEEGQERTREYLLSNEDTKKRYLLLLEKVNEELKNKTYQLTGKDGKTYESTSPGALGGNKRLKIYGKLDCPSAKRWILKEHYIQNRVFFQDEETAIAAGYRPCAVGMKEEYKVWKKKKDVK